MDAAASLIKAHGSPQEALFEACLEGQTEAALSLVRLHGADVNAVDYDGHTALFHAAAGGHAATIRALVLDLGASIDVRVATKDWARRAYKYFDNAHGPRTPLHFAAAGGHCDAVRALVR